MVSRHNRRLRKEDGVVPLSGSPLQRLSLPLMRMAFVMVGLVGVGLLSHSMWRAFVAIDALTLTTVQLVGGHRVSKEALLAAAQTGYGDPLLSLHLGDAAKAMAGHPWVRTATLRRQLPNRLHIDVEEHVPKALVMMPLGLWVVNTLGEPFKAFSHDDGFSLPVITGIHGLTDGAGAQMQAEEGVSHESQAQLTEALTLMDEVHEAFGHKLQVEQVNVDEDLGYTLYVRPNAGMMLAAGAVLNDGKPIVVHLGAEPMHRIGLVGQTLERLGGQRLAAHTIWANGERAPNRVQVRLFGPFEENGAKGAEK